MIQKRVSFGRSPRLLVNAIMTGGWLTAMACSSSSGGIDPGQVDEAGSDAETEAEAEAGEELVQPEAGDEVVTAAEASAPDASVDAATPDVAVVGEEPDAAVRPVCVFHTSPWLDMDASLPDPPEASVATVDAAAGEGGISDASSDGSSSRDGGATDAGPPGDITVENSAFVGKYLADIDGRSLYIYAADTPGDCEQPAVSVCENDCAISWPIFDAKKRRLSPALDDRLFGDIVRADGTHQTTYRGWPLYYYKTDTARGLVTGQNKGTAWWLATVIAPNITIMKTGTVKRLSDYSGYTLYAYAQDHKGDEATSPESACVGSCSGQYPPVLLNRVSAVSSLAVNDFSLFARKGSARLQLAYKGSPLYYATADARPGQINGAVQDSGWSIVAP